MERKVVLTSTIFTVLFAFSLILFQPSGAQAGENPVQREAFEQSLCQDKAPTLQGEQVARRGCCSHNKGVCGCVDGRIKCCDGTLSPTCTCLRDDGVMTN